ncbi:Voltage-dependent anion-selective channel protein 1 [Tupaia chinensis]|uniref:Non-selective voltage-gated ion channel VDAC1 n=1 Tax=Tupaia chinensis TaxID=246437 RepID=L9K508_TUPCH|nr:Voltage-dependent anion-selective channel protein 1 [Tupaia chinensis]
MIAFSDKADASHDVNCEVVAVSVASHCGQLAWTNPPRKNGDLGHMNIALLSDLTKQISRDYAPAVATHEPTTTVSKQKITVPPTYVDLDKPARDVFTKGYGFGLIKLDLKTKSEHGLEFTSSGSANTDHRSDGQSGNQGALVLGYEGWLAGHQMNFETEKSRVTPSNFTVGYMADEFQLHTDVNDGTEFGGSIYQKVNKKVETAVNLPWTAGNSNSRFEIAAKYQTNPTPVSLLK